MKMEGYGWAISRPRMADQKWNLTSRSYGVGIGDSESRKVGLSQRRDSGTKIVCRLGESRSNSNIRYQEIGG